MPTYSYRCKKCEHFFDVFHGINAEPKIKCEECGSAATERQIGTGSGIIFKGSGFYETDYKNKKGKKAESGTSSTKAKESGGSDSKKSSSDSKSSSKSGGESSAKSSKS